ncbi:hypothetical protein OB919_19255 [Halobacteria archaeon AArc-curdl1]|uniref:Uncharacterized protein n=1 Tax=Natronosalvus hydrolyticus TaxID=2979988 RepID=A0AAP3E8N1_9EURY|nr:hypothetical protein [Halobacteria archaeon AArc-curdl1]
MVAETAHLERAREHLRHASDAGGRSIQNQVDSIQAGLAEELEGHRTQDEPGPKIDRVAELIEKLDGLETEASGEASDRIRRAKSACVDFQKERGRDQAG